MTVTGPKVRDFTGATGRLPVEVVSDPVFELLLSVFVWITHRDPESDAEYAVGDTWFQGVEAAASPGLIKILEGFVGIEDLWVGLIGLTMGLPTPRSVAATAESLRTGDPIHLRRELIVRGCAHCRGITDDDLIDRAAHGEPAAIDVIAGQEDCKMTDGIRRLLSMDPIATVELIASTIERFDREVFRGGAEISEILERDADHKRQLARSLEPNQLVEVATNGVTFTMLPEVDGIVLIPSIVLRPWVTVTASGRRRVFCYPVAEEHLIADPDAPPSWLVGVYRALGDERRLRMLRILSEGPSSLGDVSARVGLAKSTVHHHLSVLRQAGLVRITVGVDKEYSIRRDAVPEVGRMLAGFLTEKS